MSIANPQHPCILKERTFHVAHASFVRIIGPHIHTQTHRLWIPNEAFIHQNPKLLGLDRQFGQISFGAFVGIFGQFTSTHFGSMSPLSMFSINQPLFLQEI